CIAHTYAIGGSFAAPGHVGAASLRGSGCRGPDAQPREFGRGPPGGGPALGGGPARPRGVTGVARVGRGELRDELAEPLVGGQPAGAGPDRSQAKPPAVRQLHPHRAPADQSGEVESGVSAVARNLLLELGELLVVLGWLRSEHAKRASSA